MSETNAEEPTGSFSQPTDTCPEALDPILTMDIPNQEVTFYCGELQWHGARGIVLLEGRIFFQWLPEAALRFEGKGENWIEPDFEDGFLVVPQKKWRFKVSPGSFKGGRMNGHLMEGLFGERQSLVDQIRFEIANLSSFHGRPIKKWREGTRLSHRGRLVFEAAEHLIILDKSFSWQDAMRKLRETGGYQCLYTGSIAMKDGIVVPFEQLNSILNAFAWYLQFINGRRTAPLFRRGLYKDQEVVADNSPFFIDRYKSVPSWTWDFLSHAAEELWPAFWTLYQDENDRECLTSALHWYVEANANAAFVEGSVVLVQNGLEMLWNWCQEKGLIARLQGPSDNWDEPFSGKLTRLLELFEIPTLIPATLFHLTEFGAHQSDISASGPVVLTFIRNAHAHADAKKRQRLRAYPAIMTFEAVQLGIWYMELILLRLLGYQGQFYNRVTREMVPLKGITWVPWSAGAKAEAAKRREEALFTREELDAFRQLIAQKATGLQQHEQKNYARIGLDISNYSHKRVEDRDFIIIGTPIFRAIMDEVLALASQRSPEKFGQRDTGMVLQGLFDIEAPPLVRTVEEFGELLKTENFAWIVEVKEGQIVGDILRVDLFRDIKPEKAAQNGESEFIGGVFHVFGHCSYQGVPLSTRPDRNELSHPTDVYEILVRGFFLNPNKEVQSNAVISNVTLPNGRKLKVVFYHETKNDVYFIKTLYRQ